VDCGQGFEGIEGELQLTGWNRKRRVIVPRRRVISPSGEAEKTDLPLLIRCGELPMELVAYEYIVLVTTMPYGPPSSSPFTANEARMKTHSTNSKTSGVGPGSPRKTSTATK